MCRLKTDNYPANPEKWSILLNVDHITLFRPNGEGGYINIPRDQFNIIIDWYNRDQHEPESN